MIWTPTHPIRVVDYSKFADMANQPYLLLSILDPGHAFMEAPVAVKTLAMDYEPERPIQSGHALIPG